MSSFSSVVRKPGQKFAPKIAPRKAIQRHAPKTTPTFETLTPESLPESPTARQPSTSQQAVNISQHNQPSTQSALTPPPTSVNEARATETEQSQPLGPTELVPEVISTSPVRRREDTVPLVSTSQVSPGTGRTRREAAAVREVQTPVEANKSREAPSKPKDVVTEPAAKRRKIALPDPDPNLDPQLRTPTQLESSSAGVLARRSNQEPLGTDALLQQVSSSARAISELANSIETRTRHSRSRTNRLSPTDEDGDYQQSRSSTPNGQSRTSRSIAIERAAAAVVAQAVRGSRKGKIRHRRGHTPEDAESHRIDEATTSMFDLLTDSGLGQRSETGKRLDTQWAEIKNRWDQKLEQNRSKAKLKPSQRKTARDSQAGDGEEVVGDLAPGVLGVPQLTLVNGNVVVMEESRQIDFSQNLVERANAVEEADVQKDERIYNYVNQNRIGKHAGLRTKPKWDRELTEKFYQGLRMFGTDFELISSLFGGDWTRRQIKAKFVREERADIHKIRQALADREQIDLNGYGAMTGSSVSGLRDPKEIQAEIEAEEKRIRDEFERAKNGDPLIEDEADMPIESIETDALVDGQAGHLATATRATPSENRFSAMADKVVKRAGQPAQKKQSQSQTQRKQREQTGASRAGAGVGGGRKSTRGKKPLEGVEERIGNVGDVEL